MRRVAEGVDGVVVQRHGRDRARTRPATSTGTVSALDGPSTPLGDPPRARRVSIVVQPGIASSARRPCTSAARSPVIASAAWFQSCTHPVMVDDEHPVAETREHALRLISLQPREPGSSDRRRHRVRGHEEGADQAGPITIAPTGRSRPQPRSPDCMRTVIRAVRRSPTGWATARYSRPCIRTSVAFTCRWELVDRARYRPRGRADCRVETKTRPPGRRASSPISRASGGPNRGTTRTRPIVLLPATRRRRFRRSARERPADPDGAVIHGCACSIARSVGSVTLSERMRDPSGVCESVGGATRLA